MSFVAAGVVGGALISAYASNSAANTQANAANNAAQMQWNMYSQNQANLRPYMTSGSATMGALQSGLQPGGQFNTNFTAADYQANQDPSYQFMLNQGLGAITAQNAANGGALSGSNQAGLVNYAENYANTGYQNAFNRWQSNQQNVYSRMMGLAGLGENAAAGAGNTAANFGQSIGSNMTGAANAQAAGTVGVANALSGSANTLGGYAYMNQLMNNQNGGMYGNQTSYYSNQGLTSSDAGAGQGTTMSDYANYTSPYE